MDFLSPRGHSTLPSFFEVPLEFFGGWVVGGWEFDFPLSSLGAGGEREREKLSSPPSLPSKKKSAGVENLLKRKRERSDSPPSLLLPFLGPKGPLDSQKKWKGGERRKKKRGRKAQIQLHVRSHFKKGGREGGEGRKRKEGNKDSPTFLKFPLIEKSCSSCFAK